MKLISLNCPNCNGPVKQVGEGKFHCENCGTSFLADYDREDVDYQKARNEAEFRKQQIHLAQHGMVDQNRKAKDQFRIKLIVIAAVFIFFMTIAIPTVIVTLKAQKSAMESYAEQERAREEKREREQQEAEERRQQEAAAKAAEEEAARQALLASYRVTPEALLADSFFLENANKTLEGQLEKNTNLYYTNWVYGEPEYITSYILIAKDENNREHNIVTSIYKVHWDKVFDDRTEHYVMYDGACLRNVSLNEDGTIKSDYAPHSLTYNSEIVANQWLSGYTDYDQLIRQEIYGNADYDYIEFKMMETSDTVDTTENTGADVNTID